MGIDVYAHWKGQTEEERQAQYTGFSVESGDVGYLREAYHGGPYATQVLCKEGWDKDQPEDGSPITAAELIARLPDTVNAVIERIAKIYPDTPEDVTARMIKAYVDFVELCARKEKETGQPCTIYVSY